MVGHFSIMGREDQNLTRTKKRVNIHKGQWSILNKNIDKYHLPYIWTEVLFTTQELKISHSYTPVAILSAKHLHNIYQTILYKWLQHLLQWPFHLPYLGITSAIHNFNTVAITLAKVAFPSPTLRQNICQTFQNNWPYHLLLQLWFIIPSATIFNVMDHIIEHTKP